MCTSIAGIHADSWADLLLSYRLFHAARAPSGDRPAVQAS
eukprot:COSAG01_NODE_1775_length_9260_cov_58.468784_10_plen_40_part_00